MTGFTMPTTPEKFNRYCLTQWISKLPWSFEIHWVRQYFINIGLLWIKDLQTSEMTVELKPNLYIGFVNIFPNFWYMYPFLPQERLPITSSISPYGHIIENTIINSYFLNENKKWHVKGRIFRVISHVLLLPCMVFCTEISNRSESCD